MASIGSTAAPPPPATATAGGQASMPGRSHSSAPKFDGTPWALKRFLAEVHDLASAKGLSTAQTIRWTITYAPSDAHELWNALPSASGHNWNAFVADLYGLYPGAEGDRKYSKADLDALVRKTALNPMTDHLQFGEYYRSFLTITTFLKSKQRITEMEMSGKFLEGLHHAFRTELAEQLRLQEPNHHKDDPWSLKVLYDAALFVLSNRNGAISVSASQALIRTGDSANPSIKTEVVDAASAITRLLESDVFLNKVRSILANPHQQQFMHPPTTYPNTYIATQYGPVPSFMYPPPMMHPNTNGGPHQQLNTAAMPPQTNGQGVPAPHQPAVNANTVPNGQYPQRPNGCMFCGDLSHYQYRCNGVEEYIARGWCVRNATGQLVLPNGDRITARLAPGNNLKERLDNWYKSNPPPGNATIAQANFVDVSATYEDRTDPWSVFINEVSAARIEEVEDEDALTPRQREEISLLTNVARAAERQIQTLTDKDTLAQYGPTTRAKAYDTTPKSAQTKRDIPPHIGKEPANNNVAPAAKGAATFPAQKNRNPFVPNIPQGPQYSYQTPIESAAITRAVYEKAMESTVTLTAKELLAVAPEVRRAFKDDIIAKRIPASVNEVLAESNEAAAAFAHCAHQVAPLVRKNDLVVANHIENLRAIDVLIEGAGAVEAIMDEGSQIIALRADVWEKTGRPLRADHLMTMESANTSRSDTKGLLPDLPIKVGDFEFFVQVQVVEDASYEMLLGRPFLTLCQARTRHFANGDSQLTLVDPNTQAVITIPTHQRRRFGPRKADTGF